MRILTLCCLLLLTFTLARAQDATPEAAAGWTIEQRCVAEPTTPPDDWTFEGTILMTSRQQLHAYQQGWETPRILIFTGESLDMPYSGQLSPDGRWYAVIDGYRQYINMIVTWQTEAIHVYSTRNDEEYVIPWDNWFASSHTLGGHGLYWVDNEHLLYSKDNSEGESWFLINPFTGEITEWNAPLNPSRDYFLLSPDSEKALYRSAMSVDWTLHNGENEIPLRLTSPLWNPDSSQFVANTLQAESLASDGIALFDLEGNVIDVIFDLSDVSANLQTWSPDSRYVTFSSQNQFYIADTQEHKVIDTCSETRVISSVWSSTSSQLAFVEYYNRQYTLQVFDFNTWQRYIVAYHQGDVIGWRDDE